MSTFVNNQIRHSFEFDLNDDTAFIRIITESARTVALHGTIKVNKFIFALKILKIMKTKPNFYF